MNSLILCALILAHGSMSHAQEPRLMNKSAQDKQRIEQEFEEIEGTTSKRQESNTPTLPSAPTSIQAPPAVTVQPPVMPTKAPPDGSVEQELNQAEGTQPEMNPQVQNDIDDSERLPAEPEAEPQEVTEESSPAETSPEESPSVVAPVDEGPSLVEQEEQRQKDLLKEKSDTRVSDYDPTLDRYPKTQPLFKKPVGPAGGGTVKVPHPRAQQGLLRIGKDGAYQYRVAPKEKNQSGSIRYWSMTAPDIRSKLSDETYKSIYGRGSLQGLSLDYEYQPFRQFGRIGLQIGTGFFSARGSGRFRTPRSNGLIEAQEQYTLYVIPLSAFLTYRFEYARRQWFIPFVSGGGTYFGLLETRDDSKSPNLAGAPAIGGGAGLLISLSRWSSESSFRLQSELGVSDLYLSFEGRALKGLYSATDFTTQSLQAGIVADF